MIFAGSRFVNTIASIDNDALFFDKRAFLKYDPNNVTVHVITQGERLDILATRYYGNPQLFWVFVDVNEDVLIDDDLIPGRTLIVPSYDDVMSYITIK